MSILEKLRQTKKLTAECKYIVHDGVGYKAYFNSDARDYAFNLQEHAYDNDLGPEPFECTKIGEYFVYTTEHCGLTLGKLGLYETMYPKVKKVAYKLLDIGIDILEDLHDDNFCLKNNEPICIDFGEFSCYSD